MRNQVSMIALCRTLNTLSLPIADFMAVESVRPQVVLVDDPSVRQMQVDVLREITQSKFADTFAYSELKSPQGNNDGTAFYLNIVRYRRKKR